MKKFLAILIFLTTLVLQGWGDTEPNDSCVQAETWTTLTARGQSSSTMSGSVSSSNQNDYYKIVLSTSGSLQITGTSIQNSNFYLLNSSCNQLTSSTNTKTPSINYTAAAGTYYLQVNRRNNDTTYSNLNAYLGYVDSERSFAPIYSSNTRGGVKIIGNSNLCLLSGGACVAPASNSNNDSGSNLGYWNIASNGSTFNSTTADIALLSGSKILFAGLYWQGYVDKRDKSKINQIKFKKPGGSYQTLTATRVDTLNGGKNYQSFVDVTSQIDVNNPNGTYAVADIMADIYADANSASVDNYAAWAMFVVYENPSESLKNVTIWDGYDSISSGSTTITASGFRTPLSGAINSSFLIFSTEGDVQSTGDYIQINNVYLKDALNPAPPPNGTATNAFNSTISSFGTNVDARNPAYPNTLGIDVDEFNVSSILSNNQTSATIRIGTSGDAFYVSAFAFSTEIYSPAIGNFDKNVSVTYASSKTCEGNQDLRGATLNYEVSFENTGTEAASNVRVYDDFQSNGILNYFDMTQTSIPTAQLLSGTAASTITCDKNATAVYCDFNRINIGTKYKINFAAKIKNTLIIADDLNISNTANAHYYNASTGEEITQIASSNMQVAGGVCAAFPVADYRFDECNWDGSINEVKDSAGSNHGASKSNTPSNPTVATTIESGQINRAGEFKGYGYNADPYNTYYNAQYYVEIPDNATLSPLLNNDAISLTGWFQLDNTNDQTILHKGDGSVQEYRVFIESNQLKFSIWNQYNSPSTIAITTATLTPGERYFFAATAEYNSATNELILNLYLKTASNSYSQTATISSFSPPATSPGNLYIGAVSWGSLSGFFDGIIDEIKIFNSPLSENNINKIFTNELAHNNYDGSSRNPISCTITPQADYRFDECSWSGANGEVTDNSANGYHGTALSSLTTNENGQICRMSTFNGSSQYITIPQNAADILRSTASLSFWIKTTQTGNDTNWLAPGISGVEQSGGQDDIFWGWIDASGRIGLNAKGDGTQAKSTTAINDGTWKHIVLTRNASTGALQIYINGNLNASGTGGTGTIGTTFSRLGSITDTANTHTFFNGDLDEVKIFDSILSASQIQSIYSNESTQKNYDGNIRACEVCIPAPLVEYRFDECSWNGAIGDVIDSSNNYDAQPKNSANVNSTDTKMCNSTDLSTANKYIELPSTNYIPVSSPWSLTSWVKFPLNPTGHQTISGYNYFILGSVQNGGDLGYFGRRTTTGAMVFGVYSITGGSTEVSIATPSDGWHHVSLINNGTTTAYYLDGAFITSVNKSVTGNIRYIATSYDNPTGQNMGTLLDEYKIFSVALDTAQITTLVSRESTGYQYDGTLRNCPNCNVTPDPVYSFDAWDTFRSINDRNISTKIVNKPFDLTIASLNETNDGYQDFNGTVCARLIDNASNALTSWAKLTFASEQSKTASFTLNRAIGGNDNARVSLMWKKDAPIATACDALTDTNSSIASDRFAVRPIAFSLPSANGIAGVDFNITFTAPNFSGSASSDYNETAGGSFDVSIAEHNPLCTLGTFSPTPSSFSFVNGTKIFTTRYSEVGVLDVNITDLSKSCAERYAKIDCDDADVSGHYSSAGDLPIGLIQSQITVKPHHFDVTGTLSNFAGGTFTYLSDDLNMSAQLDLNITAKNGEGTTTANYSSACYAKNTDLTLVHSSIPDPLTKILYTETLSALNTNVLKADPWVLSLNSTLFNSGSVTPNIDLNFDRSPTKPLNPFDFNITSATATDADTVTGTGIPLGDTTFVFGRARAYDVTTNETSAPNPIEFEVYSTTSNGFVSGMPQNVLKWYRNLDHDASTQGEVILGGFIEGSVSTDIDTSASPANGLQIITITSTHDQSVHLDISPWLWYSPKYSYDYSGDCTRHPCFRYDFTDATAGVQGVNSGSFQGSDFQMAPAKNITNKGVKLFR